MKEIGEMIKNRRNELQLTQQNLADLAEVGINTIVAIERGTGNPSLGTLQKICDVIGYRVSLE